MLQLAAKLFEHLGAGQIDIRSRAQGPDCQFRRRRRGGQRFEKLIADVLGIEIQDGRFYPHDNNARDDDIFRMAHNIREMMGLTDSAQDGYFRT